MQTRYDLSITQEDISTVKKKLNITVPAEAVKEEIKSAYQSLRSSAAIAGFRKGNVPVSILKARFGPQVQDDVAKRLVESSYPHALSEKDLAPVEAPKVDIHTKDLQEGAGFSYSVTVEVNPKLEIAGYRGMELEKKKVEVTDKDIEDGLKNLRESRAEFKEVDRAAKEGDMLVVDFEAFMDGSPIKDSKTSEYPVIIGEKTLLPGFDDALKGAAKGDNKDARITFPANYSKKDLAGKESVFKITVKTVKEKTVPALDDEFAKDLECENLEGLKTKLREELAKVKEGDEKERLKNQVLDKLLEKHSFEVPEALVNRYLSILLNRVLENMRQGIFAPGEREMSPEDLRAKYRAMAERQVREDIVLDSIAAREKLEITKEESDAAVRRLAEQRNVSFESLMGRIEREGALEVIKDGMKHEKVFDIILETSKPAS